MLQFACCVSDWHSVALCGNLVMLAPAVSCCVVCCAVSRATQCWLGGHALHAVCLHGCVHVCMCAAPTSEPWPRMASGWLLAWWARGGCRLAGW